MKAKKWITWLCVVTLLAQTVLVGFPSIDVKAAEPQAQALSSDQGQIYYYDLADGNYYLSGSTITVNGEVKASGSVLDVPGDYTVVKTFTDRNGVSVANTQTVVLYKQGDASPDGEYNIKDLVAMKKHLQGIEITKAGKMAIDAYTNNPGASLMREVLLGIKTAEEAFPRVGRPLSYQVGSDSVMPIGGFAGPGYLNPAVVTDIQSSALTDFRTDAIYSLLADAGINLITATTNATASGESVEQVQQLELALAEKYGISMFVQPSYSAQVDTNPEYFEQYLRELSGYASFAGITLKDEPWSENYYPGGGSYDSSHGWDSLKALAQMTNQYTNLTGYTNLLPYWESMGTEDDYRAYLDEYFENYGNPKQIAFDYYVFSDGENVGGRNAAEYFTNLKLIKEAADKYNVPFWATVQAGNYVSGNIIRNSKDNAYMSDGMTRWTVHTALAYGAQGITYYPLVQPYNYALQKNILGITTSTYNYDRNGIIGADGTTTPYYDYIKNVNQQILAVDEVLLNSVNNGLIVTEGTAAATETGSDLYGYGAMTHLLSSNTAKGAMAGSFNYYGSDAYYVVNYDYAAAQDITLYFNGDYTLSVTVNGKTQLVNTENSTYTLNLRAGDAALVLVNGEDVTDAETVIAQIDAIPENAEMPKYYTAVVNAQAAYENLDKIGKMNISAELTEKLNSLVELAASYAPLTAAEGSDTTYGPITEYNLTNATQLTDSLHKADIGSQYGEVVFYVFNPNAEAVNADYNSVSVTLNAGWTLVTVPVSAYSSGDNTLTFANPVSGLWKVTRYYGKNDENLKERVQSAIDALPDVVNLSLSHEEQVKEARAMYEALSTDLQAHVNTAKLIACENKLIVLKQELAGKLPLVIPNASISAAEDVAHDKDVYDATYEKVMTFADAGYFAIPSSSLTEEYKTSKSAILYVYNPTEQNAYLGVQLGDNGWIHRDRVTLYAGKWTAIDLFDRGTTHTYTDPDSGTVTSFVDNYLTSGETLYFYAVNGDGAASTFAGEGWMVSGVYGMNEYKAGDTVVYDVVANEGLPGTKTGYEIVADDNFGSVFAFESTGYFVLNAEMKSKEFKSCQDVAFYIYNPTADWVTGNIVAGGGYTNYVALRPNSWNRIVLCNYAGTEGSQFLSNGNTIEFNMTLPATEDGAKWKMTNFYGTLDLASTAADVNALINALPEANAIGSSHKAAVNEAKLSYDALVESEQAKIENKEKLDACVAKVAQWDAYDAKTVIPATTASVAPYADDNTFGIAWTPAAGNTYVVLGSKDAAYAECQAIEFYIYNPTDAAVNGFIQNDVDWSNHGNLTLAPKAWTKVTVNQTVVGGKNLLSADVKLYVYVSFAGEGWKISSVYGVTAADMEANAIAALNETIANLPEADAIGGSHKATIKAAKATYDGLSVTAQGMIENVEKLDACLAKVDKWDDYDAKTVLDGNGAVLMPTPNETATVIQNVDDNTFGFTNLVVGGEHLFIHNAYLGDAVEFYVYNPTASDVSSYFVIDTDWGVSQSVTLTANAWTCVHVEWAKLVPTKGHMYFYAAMTGDGWKVSNVYQAEVIDTEAEAVSNVNVLISALPEASEIGSSHEVAIAEAKAAYDALSEEGKAKIENVDKLNACVAKVASWNKQNAVVDAAYQTLGADGTLTVGVDNNIFGSVYAVSGGTYVAVTPSVKTENPAFKASKNIGFHIYNPTDSDVEGYYTMDWGYNRYFLLKAKSWSYVEFADYGTASGRQMITSDATIYFYVKFAGEGWLISSMYSQDTNVDGLTTVVDASYQTLGAEGTLTVGVDNDTFGKVYSVSGGTYVAVTNNVKTEIAAFRESKDIVFYIYNPTDSDVEGYYTMDWNYNEYFLLKANSWNRIVFSDFSAASGKQMISSDATVYFYVAFNGEGWLVSSFYALPEPGVEENPEAEAIAAVNAQIAALPEANALGGSNTDAVNAAKTAFDALSEAGQASVENAEKLNACVAKVNTWAVLGRKTVVDAGYQALGADGTLTAGVDNNTFGKVYSVSGGTYVAVTNNVKTENSAFKASKNIGFYIYNPTDSDVEGYYTMDWGYNRYFLLKAKSWSYVEFADYGTASGRQMITSDATVYFYVAFNGEGWLISSMYSQDTNVDGLTTVVDASYQTLGAEGTLTVGVDNNTFGKAYSVSGGTYVAVTNNIKTEIAAFRESKDIVFYIYNPTDSDVEGYYTMDWGYNEYFLLKANSWNRIVFSDFGAASGKQMISSDATVYFYVAFNGEGWLVSGFYALPDYNN